MQALSIDTLTDTVVGAMGPKTSPRAREVMSALIRHLHDFAREVNLTTQEWLAGLEMLNRAGKMSDDKRNEMILVCDVLGLESLVDALDNKAEGFETESAVLGPFYRENAPVLPLGASIVQGGVPGETVLVTGRVTSSTGEPLVGAILDIWETSPNGLYEQQDPDQPEMNLRGRFETDASGNYAYRALTPRELSDSVRRSGGRPAPTDGPPPVSAGAHPFDRERPRSPQPRYPNLRPHG